jgi:hypothetical protein
VPFVIKEFGRQIKVSGGQTDEQKETIAAVGECPQYAAAEGRPHQGDLFGN